MPQLWGYFPPKPLVDSNTVHLFKAISNMSCLTSFKSYLTPRNSHEFTVGIKEENILKGREIITSVLFAVVIEKGCLLRDEYIIYYYHGAKRRLSAQRMASSEGARRVISLIAAIKAHGNKIIDF